MLESLLLLGISSLIGCIIQSSQHWNYAHEQQKWTQQAVCLFLYVTVINHEEVATNLSGVGKECRRRYSKGVNDVIIF